MLRRLTVTGTSIGSSDESRAAPCRAAGQGGLVDLQDCHVCTHSHSVMSF